MDTNKSIALAGIAATALVGVTGGVSAWLIARDDRANQRALAHDARVYDRRAGAYLAALQLIEKQRLQILNTGLRAETENRIRLKVTSPLMGYGRDGFLHAQIVAFGSSGIVTAFENMAKRAEAFYGVESHASFQLTEKCGPDSRTGMMFICLQGKAREKVVFTTISKLYATHAAFEKDERRFELMVQRELS